MTNEAPEVVGKEGVVSEFFSRLCAYPALTIMLYSRKRLGFNTTAYFKIFALYIALTGLGFSGMLVSALLGVVLHRDLGAFSALSLFDPWLLLFAQSVAVIGVVTHIRRLREFKEGVMWWSQSAGIPRVTELFPGVKPYIMRRVIEPAAIFVLGIGILVTFSKLLGLWLMWAAFCLAVHEQLEADKRFHQAMEFHDMIVLSNLDIAAGVEEDEEPSIIGMAESMDRRRQEQNQVADMFGVSADENAEEIRLNMQRRRRRQKQTHEIDYGAAKQQPQSETPDAERVNL